MDREADRNPNVDRFWACHVCRMTPLLCVKSYARFGLTQQMFGGSSKCAPRF